MRASPGASESKCQAWKPRGCKFCVCACVCVCARVCMRSESSHECGKRCTCVWLPCSSTLPLGSSLVESLYFRMFLTLVMKSVSHEMTKVCIKNGQGRGGGGDRDCDIDCDGDGDGAQHIAHRCISTEPHYITTHLHYTASHCAPAAKCPLNLVRHSAQRSRTWLSHLACRGFPPFASDAGKAAAAPRNLGQQQEHGTPSQNTRGLPLGCRLRSRRAPTLAAAASTPKRASCQTAPGQRDGDGTTAIGRGQRGAPPMAPSSTWRPRKGALAHSWIWSPSAHAAIIALFQSAPSH